MENGWDHKPKYAAAKVAGTLNTTSTEFLSKVVAHPCSSEFIRERASANNSLLQGAA